MKRRFDNSRRGVVLLLILGLMAMFAISVLSYMYVTSNMAEIAVNQMKADTVVETPAENDLDVALRTLVIGSNNPANPIGPFSLLENMYGDWTAYKYDSSDPDNISLNGTAFQARIAIFPSQGIAVLTPYRDFYGNLLEEMDDYDCRRTFMQLFEESGNVMTLLSLDTYLLSSEFDLQTCWDADVTNTSTFVLEKVITDPSSSRYPGGYGPGSYWLENYCENPNDSTQFAKRENYADFDFWHFKVDLSDDLKKFVNDFVAGNSSLDSFNEGKPTVTVRMNRPAFSGTGAGGFAAGAHHDSTFTPLMPGVDHLRLPFAFWQNAGAPDLWPYRLSSVAAPSFRAYWAHLADVNYDASLNGASSNYYYTALNNTQWEFRNPVYNGNWIFGDAEPARMNPPYTAPDNRSPFLAHFYFDDDGTSENPIVPYASIQPSFHRTEAFRLMGFFLHDYRSAYDEFEIKPPLVDVYLTALLRKLTPRPLPLDHWNFTGGNPDVVNFYYEAGKTPEDFAQTFGFSEEWDVDNDNDGVREGIWIPSGLPIRYDKNGTPYATMFSYTVLDLDGRVNVNTAGNWDQLPNRWKDAEGIKYLHPYNYIKDLIYVDDQTGTGNLGGAGDIGWRDDLDRETSFAERGEGRGANGVFLYEALAAAFDAYNDNDNTALTVASNLLWRRNLAQFEHPTEFVDTSDLIWSASGFKQGNPPLTDDPQLIDVPQPGHDGGFESDELLRSRVEFFRFNDPFAPYKVVEGGDLFEGPTVYPWRGKTSLRDRVYDWADSAFRSYDPLGAQVYSYPPSYSDIPYLAYQNARSWQDSPYTLPMLERFLRPNDADAATLPSQLVDDLRMNSDSYADSMTASNVVRDRARARHAFTTISSDVNAASVVFPDNFAIPGNDNEDGVRYGSYGFVDLVRRNVESELKRVFEQKGICEFDEEGNNIYLEPFRVDGSPNHNYPVFERKVEEITAYLAAMLPKEILNGEKIDLNALAQKNYWLDVYYNGDNIVVDRSKHNEGLVKRMEYARGLYLVVMTLLYEDMNARRLHDPTDQSSKLSDYIEGSFDLLSFENLDDDENDTFKGIMARGLMATRIAQWCVNVVDFSDPDATMTPFFFDPTPFDGWWVKDYPWIDGDEATINNWKTYSGGDPSNIAFLFPSVSPDGTPTQRMNKFFLDVLKASAEFDEDMEDLIVELLTSPITHPEDQTSDLGFRCIWGMERPDLVLTETLSFHDLGVADTNLEEGVDDPVDTANGDETFDQVRRPQGSSYLELYCTANPNVPQSSELYEDIDDVWQLQLSKKTPWFTKDIDGVPCQLDFPIWRVAISDSSDPRGIYKVNGGDKPSPDSVYHKSRNNVLEWLMPHKDGDKYNNDINFFSMQPRQFRNAPMRKLSGNKIRDISELDLYQATDAVGEPKYEPKYLERWEKYNLLSSNILGPAVAATYDNPELREIELDRILWFVHAEGDGGGENGDGNDEGKALGTAGKFPDALRTFCNDNDKKLYLEPNEYLVVGPDLKRSVGFATTKAPDAGEAAQFGQPPRDDYKSSYINIYSGSDPDIEEDKGLWYQGVTSSGGTVRYPGRYKHMVAKANIGGRGFNISEPLWTADKVDPYYSEEDPDVSESGVSKEDRVFDLPFEIPNEWLVSQQREVSSYAPESTAKNHPIIKDRIFGFGTIPAYKSAFVQRVADPNRPYHPIMNPYITVDWNVMDLTIFTGEVFDATLDEEIDEINKKPLANNDVYPFVDSQNRIKLARNLAVGLDKDDMTIGYDEAFSSRQWGAQSQKMFSSNLSDSRRPNPWARGVKAEGNKGGLEGPGRINVANAILGESPAMTYIPQHTLGLYNDYGEWGQWETDEYGNPVDFVQGQNRTEFRNLNATYLKPENEDVGNVYQGVPRHPYEHLVWNDAPFSNPYELLMVPASSPGRFGLEFIRKGGPQMRLRSLYKVDPDRKGSLGSYSHFGFDDWYTADNIKQKKDEDGNFVPDEELEKLQKRNTGSIGPYLNFFASSKKPGDTLNLANVLEFVKASPSNFLGTKKVTTDPYGNFVFDEFGNVELRPTHREPGKVNINTLSKPVWNALVNTTERDLGDGRLPGPGTPWNEFVNSRYLGGWQSWNESNVQNPPSKYFFQPSHTTPLWIQMDRSKAPVGTFSTLLTQRNRDDFEDHASYASWNLFDNVREPFNYDENGNTLYSYSYRLKQTVDGETKYVEDVATYDWIMENLPSELGDDGVVSYEEVLDQRGNLYDATAEMQRLSGVTTTRSNVFAVWVTVGYFEVERCKPGVNMPDVDPDGFKLTVANLSDPTYKWYHYYQAIYPDGYTYGRELGEEYGETKRARGFSIIDRSVPVDFRRGSSVNYQDSILMKHVIK